MHLYRSQPKIAAGSRELFFNITENPLVVGDNAFSFTIPYNMELQDLKGSLLTASEGLSVIIDFKKDGVSIFRQALEFDPGVLNSKDSVNQVLFSSTVLKAGTVLTIDIIQVGDVVPGGGLQIWIFGKNREVEPDKRFTQLTSFTVEMEQILKYANEEQIPCFPSEDCQILINTFISRLKAENIFQKFDFAHLFANDSCSAHFGFYNLVNPLKHKVSVNSFDDLGYTEKTGIFKITGAASIEVDYKPAIDGIRYELNQGSFGFRSWGDTIGQLRTGQLGSPGFTGTVWGGYEGNVYINNHNKMNFGAPVRINHGADGDEEFFVAQKINTNQNQLFIDGNFYKQVIQSPLELSASNVHVVGADPTQFIFWGSAFTSDEVLKLHQILNEYITEIRK